MNKSTIRIIILSVALISLNSFGKTYELSETGNEIIIKGTSNLHNWSMEVVTSNCVAEFDIEGVQLKNITNVDFTCKSKDIRSNNNLMDRKTYEAIRAERFPEINFTLLSSNGLVSAGREFNGTLKGNLTVAGTAREIVVPFEGILNNDNTISVEGSVELKMSDFKIDPPTALLGALKTGDLITITFSLKLSGRS